MLSLRFLKVPGLQLYLAYLKSTTPNLSSSFPFFKGNIIKATSILHKAQAMNARPAELLETAIRNLKTGEKQLVPTRNEEEEEPSLGTGLLGLSKEMLLVVGDVMFNFYNFSSELKNRVTAHCAHWWGKSGSAYTCSGPCEPVSGPA